VTISPALKFLMANKPLPADGIKDFWTYSR
jgi:hypothetical protein